MGEVVSEERAFRERLECQFSWLAPDVITELVSVHNEIMEEKDARIANLEKELSLTKVRIKVLENALKRRK